MATKIIRNPGVSIWRPPGKSRNAFERQEEFELLIELLGDDDMEHNETFMIDSSEFDSARAAFARVADFDCYGQYIDLVASNRSMEDVLNIVRSVTGTKTRFVFSNVHSNSYATTASVSDGEKDIAIVQVYFSVPSPFEVAPILRGNVSIFGEKEYVKTLHKKLDEEIGHENIPTARWHYISDGSHNHVDITVTSNVTLKDEYYPFIEGGVEAFIDKYLESKDAILILLGPPGTGKSTLLRHMIVSRKLNVTLTYEERLLQQDKLFINHLSSSNKKDLLVLEDADVLLESREKCGNHIMQKLLNVSDGIIKVMNKKIVFSTNLPSVRSIDSALLRPGRCFGVIQFRELSYQESLKAAEAAGLKLSSDKERKYTLAELFQGEAPTEKHIAQIRKVGF